MSGQGGRRSDGREGAPWRTAHALVAGHVLRLEALLEDVDHLAAHVDDEYRHGQRHRKPSVERGRASLSARVRSQRSGSGEANFTWAAVDLGSVGMLALDGRQREVASRLAPALGQLGVCPRCALRFVGVQDPAQYARPQPEAWADLLRAAGAEPAQACADVGACCVCLGVLALADDAAATDKLLAELGAAAIGAPRFALEVALPPSILVRQRGVYLHASASLGREAVPRNEAMIEAKNVLKWQLAPLLAARLGAARDDAAPFQVSLTVEHADSAAEAEAVVYPRAGGEPHGGKRQKLHDPVASSVRSVLKALFEPDCRGRLERAKLCPPPAPSRACAVSLAASHAPICIAGRYNKYSREMPQTPWWLDNEKRGISSVQEALQPALLAAYGARASVFHGSGREDIDVRMLGSGRPFVLELTEPTLLAPGAEVGTPLPALEAAINGGSELVQVRTLLPAHSLPPAPANQRRARASADAPRASAAARRSAPGARPARVRQQRDRRAGEGGRGRAPQGLPLRALALAARQPAGAAREARRRGRGAPRAEDADPRAAQAAAAHAPAHGLQHALGAHQRPLRAARARHAVGHLRQGVRARRLWAHGSQRGQPARLLG